MKTSYTLFNAFGIPVTVDLSVLILMFILVSSFGDLFFGLAAGVILLVSILLHELGHSLVGMAFGGKVRDIRLMLLGGCATMTVMPKKAWQESLMAFAGPFVSLLIVVSSFAVLYFGFIPYQESEKITMLLILKNCFYWAVEPQVSNVPFMWFLLSYAVCLNIVLFIFNMLPAFPMDGGRILRATLQQFFTTRLKATWIASRIGRFLAILFGLRVLYVVLTSGFYNFALIQLLVAYMIYQAAEREYQMVLAEEQGTRRNPFSGFPFFGQRRNAPPPDDGQAVVSPPPYQSRGSTRVDVHKEN